MFSAAMVSAAFALLLLAVPAFARDPFAPSLAINGTQHKGRYLKVFRAESTAGAARGAGHWSVAGTDFLDASGNVVKFSGVTWSGFEKPDAVFGGLDKRPYADHLDQMASLGFNVLRLPFAGETLLPTTFPGWGKIDANPDLKGLTSLQIMDKMIDECTARGIKVILDYHRMKLSWDNEVGTWWDDNIPESVWLDNWSMLAKRYGGNPTVIGADLYNEVHPNKAFPDGAPFWMEDAGEHEPYNFRRATLSAIETIHALEPNWIIFMEGMWNGPYWWGGNCAQLLNAPITKPASKLAYSAHDYGPYVADLGQFHADNFPDNLEAIFYSKWGVIVEKGIAPLWIGEFGSFYPPPTNDRNVRERAVFEKQLEYIGKIGASWTIAFWGPDTKDTGSILEADWITVNAEKMKLLAPIMHPNFT